MLASVWAQKVLAQSARLITRGNGVRYTARIMATPSPGFEDAIGERASYHGLDILVFKERAAYRVQVAERPRRLFVGVLGTARTGFASGP